MVRWLLLVLCGCGQPAVPVVSTGADSGGTATGGTGGDDSAGDSGTPGIWGTVLITELMADNEGAVIWEDGGSPDWIELYNPGPDPVELDGWAISDDPDDTDPHELSGTLLPGEFRVWAATGEAGEDHLPFALSADGEAVVLWDPSGSVADRLEFGAQHADISFGRPQVVEATVLLDDGDSARMAGGQPTDWDDPDLDDSDWETVILPVGFDEVSETSDELALLAETSQSTDGFSRTGAQAVDGDSSTFSHTDTADMDPWWEVDLGGEATVTSLSILNRLDCCASRLYNLTVEVLDGDGEVTWTSELLNPVAEGETPETPGEIVDPGLDEAVVGRFVRVSKEAVGGVYDSEWLSLAEVQVSGAWGAPYDLWIETEVSELMASGEGVVRADVEVPEELQRLTLAVRADDGFEARLDGEVVASADAVGGDVEDAVEYVLEPSLSGGLLAVHLVDSDGEDALLGLRLLAERIETLTGEAFFTEATPGAPNGEGFPGYVDAPTVSPERHWLDGPTTVTLSAPDATIMYTLDGSVPSDEHGELGEGTVEIEVSGTTLLRAIALRADHGDSPVVTHTYLSMDDVLGQPVAPPGLPETWDGLSQSAVSGDYEMDPEVVEAYEADLEEGLRAIPTLSVVMPHDDLWGEDSGIYVHSEQRGDAWERAASIELIEPDDSHTQVDCGVRIHGYGWRSHSNTKKHSLRLEFRSEYGPGKWAYPLFPEAPVDRFDSIVLRSQGSRGWQDFRDPEQAQYIRDAFARDTALAMGKADGHAAYVHLFLNGLYWGLYMAVERPDADFGAERFGGEADEYDAINRRTTTNEAIDGDLEAYNTLLELADEDLAVAENYETVEAMIDLDDLVDYMLIHQYTTNRDGPEQFSHNNMRGVRRRVDGERFRFFVWDMEYSLWDAEDHINIDVDVAGSVSHVYARLRDSEAFRERYAERAAMHLSEDGGALTAQACLERYEARADEIYDAVVAESARWGDTDRSTPYTRDVEWAEERRRLVDEYFPERTDVLIEQLRDAGLY